MTLRIREILTETPRARVVRLDLKGQRFDYLAGQAVLVGQPSRSQPEHAPEPRPYSIAISPDEARRQNTLELLVGVDASGLAGAHLTLHAGADVEIEGPLGSFTFPENPGERRFVFIAGGTGIAPLRAMLHQALAVTHEQIALFYSARTPDEFSYEREFRQLASAGRIAFHQTVTRSAGEAWSGARGRIGRADLQRLVDDHETLCFICGPQALVSSTSSLLREMGIDEPRIRIERWGA